jgi:hypothetical protein
MSRTFASILQACAKKKDAGKQVSFAKKRRTLSIPRMRSVTWSYAPKVVQNAARLNDLTRKQILTLPKGAI